MDGVVDFRFDEIYDFESKGILVRPVWRVLASSDVQHLSAIHANALAHQRGTWIEGVSWAECADLEHYLMAGGKALAWRAGHGFWPYNTIDHNSEVGQFLFSMPGH